MDAWHWFECPCRKVYSFILDVLFVGRMPLFVFVSGYLFAHLVIDRGKYKTFKGFVSNKVKRLLIPCLTFTGLLCICLQTNYIEAIIGSCYHLWFLKMLFWCFITGWILNRFVSNTYLRLFMWLASILMMGLRGVPYFGIEQYFKYFAFFYSGYLFYAYHHNLNFVFKKGFLLLTVLAYVLLAGIALYQYIFNYSDGITHSDKIVVVSRYLLRPITILIAFILVDFYLRGKSRISVLFTKINNISYGIYLFHMLLLQCLYKYFLNQLSEISIAHYIITPPLLFIAVLLVSITICQWLKKFKWSKWLIG